MSWSGWMRRLLRVVLLLVLVIPTVRAQAQVSGPIYIVQPGDTLTGIAAMFGTSVDALVELNSIADASLVYPGAELAIPGFEGVSGVLATRPIEFGETLASLSLRNGVAQDTIVRLNRVTNPGRLYVGEPVIVPESSDIPMALPQATLLAPAAGATLLETAVLSGANPWTLRLLNHQPDRMWIVPGAVLAVPGGASPTSALPEPVSTVEVTPQPAIQGRTVEVRLGLSGSAWAEGTLGEWTLHFNELDPLDLVALQGVYAMAEPGLYDLDLRLLASQGGELIYAFSQPVLVIDGGYLSDPPLTVPAETIDPAVTEPENQLIASIVDQFTAERMWEGTFQFPSPYTDCYPSRFGSRRSYNGSGYIYYHTGLDFCGSTTTPVLAPAPGRVVFVGPLTVRGNATIIDHGWGVFTGYLHQSQILVSVGDIVETGQTIGMVGATGRVTGPHLHWDVYVGGIPVNPLEWTSTAFP
jgi:murein DD-endopeptidase MepM/ murein hydrolase activator NlpD